MGIRLHTCFNRAEFERVLSFVQAQGLPRMEAFGESILPSL